MVIRDRKHSLPNPLVYTNIYEFQNNPFATQFIRVKKRDLKKISSNNKVYMVKVRIIIREGGFPDIGFETEIIKPRIGELISIRGNHYEVKFIQYIFSDENQFEHLLVTATKER